MAAQSTWRLGFSGSNGGQYIQLTEVAFLDAAGVDLSVGGTASASSQYDASYSAAKAFDKSNATDWCTVYGGVPAWLQYVHAAPADVAQVRIVCSANSSWLPASAGQMSLAAGGAQETQYGLRPVSGTFSPGATVILSAAIFQPPIAVLGPQSICLSGGMAGNAGIALSPVSPSQDMQDGGLHRMAGTVELKGTPNTPLRRRVQLWNQRDGRMVRETWSDAVTGAYAFDYIRGGAGVIYCAVSYDHTGINQGVIADNLTPEAM